MHKGGGAGRQGSGASMLSRAQGAQEARPLPRHSVFSAFPSVSVPQPFISQSARNTGFTCGLLRLHQGTGMCPHRPHPQNYQSAPCMSALGTHGVVLRPAAANCLQAHNGQANCVSWPMVPKLGGPLRKSVLTSATDRRRKYKASGCQAARTSPVRAPAPHLC